MPPAGPGGGRRRRMRRPSPRSSRALGHQPAAPTGPLGAHVGSDQREAGNRRRGPAGAAAPTRRPWRSFPIGVALPACSSCSSSSAWPRHASIPCLRRRHPTRPCLPARITGPPADAACGRRWRRWLRPPRGRRTLELLISKVDEVCPSRQGCQALGADTTPRPVDLGGTPTGVTLSKNQDQLGVQSSGTSSTQAGQGLRRPARVRGPGDDGEPALGAPDRGTNGQPEREPGDRAPQRHAGQHANGGDPDRVRRDHGRRGGLRGGWLAGLLGSPRRQLHGTGSLPLAPR